VRGKTKNPGMGATNLGRDNEKDQFDRFSRCRFEAISLKLAVPILALNSKFKNLCN
jgi:hypothetical protein